MIRKVSLFPEIARPVGLEPAVMDRLGTFDVLVGPNGSGKSRLLGLVRLMFELAPRTDELRAQLSRKLSVADDPSVRERLHRSLDFVEALARPDAILVDGEEGLRRPSSADRWVDLTYGSGAVSRTIAAAFPDLPSADGATRFATAYHSAPAFLHETAKALFYGRLAVTASRPGVAEALREAMRFNEIAGALLGKEVTPEVSEGLEIAASLGGRRFQATELSPGEALLLTWAILLHKQAPSRQAAVVAIDEPELHLHPTLLQRILSSILSTVGGGGQLWVVTHSPEVAARPDVSNLFLVERGAVRSLRDPPTATERRELGLVVDKPPHVLPSPRAAKAPLGQSDFLAIRSDASLLYVDKTGFIEDVLRNPAAVLLFPRPRRFGKSLNLSTLRYFIEKCPEPERQRRATLFEGLRVWKSEAARSHFGRYPVIYLNLKATKADSFSSLFKSVRNEVRDQYERHHYLLDEGTLSASDRALYEKILRAEGEPEDYAPAIKRLSGHLEAHHRERVVILVDEYDTPLTEAYDGGFLDEATRFLGNFFSAALKDNPHLLKGVLTGVLRIARESLFSDLNNLSVHSILRPEFASHFGFTEGEVEELCMGLGSPELMSDLREWYDGYHFGDQLLYNPWSVLSCLNSDDKRLDSYWADTSSNKLLRRQLLERGRGLDGHELLKLLSGEPIDKLIDENLVLRSLDTAPNAIWSLLLFAGYLTPTEPPHGAEHRSMALVIPNLEVKRELESLVRESFSRQVGGEDDASHLRQALWQGDVDVIQAHLNRFLMRNVSYFDKDRRQPELAYKMFLLGIFTFLLPSHEVISELPSGRGRADLTACPRTAGDPGICLELKVRDGKEDVDTVLTEALRQIDERGYVSRLEARGAHPIHKLAVVFDGQEAKIRRG